MPIPAVILAAGASRRLGAPKQALLWQGEALLHRAARVALESVYSPVIVVLGAAMEASLEALAGLGVDIVVNPAWAEGMGSSIRAGVAALPEDAKAVLLLVCDQPALSREHLEEIRRLHGQAPDQVIVSAYAGIRGVPALVPKGRFPELQALAGDRGAQGLFRCGDLREVPFPGGDLDVDTPGDLEFHSK